jgi:hypothetical protein
LAKAGSERRVTGQRRVHVGDGDDRAIEAEELAERAHRDRVGDPGHPPVNRVEGRRGDHDGVGLGHALGLVGLTPAVADREAGDGAKQRRVDERQRLRGGGNGDLPAGRLGELHEVLDLGGGGAAQTIT